MIREVGVIMKDQEWGEGGKVTEVKDDVKEELAKRDDQ